MNRTRLLLTTLLILSIALFTACGGGGNNGTNFTQSPPPAPPLTIVTTSLPEAIEGVAYSQQLQASGGTAPYSWTLDSPFVPAGLAMSASGVVSGTPTFSFQKTTFGIQVTLRDSAGRAASGSIEIPVAGKVKFINTDLFKGNNNIPYQFDLSPTGGLPPYKISFSTGALPAGITLNSTTLSGTPTEFGTFNFGVQITDSDTQPQTATIPFTLTIANDFAFFPQIQLPIAVQSKPYSAQIKVVNGVLPYHFSLGPNSTLTPGLSLDATTGLISGTPTQTGNPFLAVQVTDSEAPTKTIFNSYFLTVNPPLFLPNRANLDDGVQNRFYASTLAPGGGVPPYTITVTAGSPPAGVAATQLNDFLNFSGTPTTLGTTSITVQVRDSEPTPDVVSRVYAMRVNPVLSAQGPRPFPVGIEGQPYSAQFSAAGGVPPYQWTLALAPNGLTINPATGLVSGTPSTPFEGTIFVNVSDSAVPSQFSGGSGFAHIAGRLKITTSTLPQVVSNSTVNVALGMKGGTGPFVWSVSSGVLPTGLSLGPGGVISGTVTGASSPFTVTLTDQGAPAQTANANLTLNVAAAAGRNDTIAAATPLSNGTYFASLSPIADPVGATAAPDVDIYKFTSDPGAIVHLETFAQRLTPESAADTVIELTDANGARLQTCNLFGLGNSFTLPCMNDDNPTSLGLTDSILYFQAPSSATGPVTFYLKVLDFRGDARPDMTYQLVVDGAK